MTFWRCYYHIIWATKNREPLITAKIEVILHDAIREKADELGSQIFAINGIEDHTHIAVSIPPKIAVAEWVKRVKGSSSHTINTMFPNTLNPFRWQGGYGVLSYGTKVLPFIVDYIENQKNHHANNTLQNYLEIVEEPE